MAGLTCPECGTSYPAGWLYTVETVEWERKRCHECAPWPSIRHAGSVEHVAAVMRVGRHRLEAALEAYERLREIGGDEL